MRVSFQLDGLGVAIPPSHRAHLIATAEEIRTAAGLLRQLADESDRHFQRIDVMINYLNVMLPSIQKSLNDISKYYEDRRQSRDLRWRTMYHAMTEEAGNLPLPQRFMLYNQYLSGLCQLLVRDPHFDDNTFQPIKDRIVALRAHQKLPAAVDVVPFAHSGGPLQLTSGRERVHWAQDIFSRPLTSRTPQRGIKYSEAFGPFSPMGQAALPPRGSKILFERQFDEGTLTLTVYEAEIKRDQTPYLLITYKSGGTIQYSHKGAHELGISRERSSLVLRRWSRSQKRPVHWAILYFLTWEEMVLFYCSFISLKARSPQTLKQKPDEFQLRSETLLFQARILDDGYDHFLIVYEDKYTKGWRLHAAVWNGELQRVPVWTAFITKHKRSSDFLEPQSTHRIRLRDVTPYVFCNEYSADRQRHGRRKLFELNFHQGRGARIFEQLFHPALPSSTDPSETTTSSNTSTTTSSEASERDAADDGYDARQAPPPKLAPKAKTARVKTPEPEIEETSSSSSNVSETRSDSQSSEGGRTARRPSVIKRDRRGSERERRGSERERRGSERDRRSSILKERRRSDQRSSIRVEEVVEIESASESASEKESDHTDTQSDTHSEQEHSDVHSDDLADDDSGHQQKHQHQHQPPPSPVMSISEATDSTADESDHHSISEKSLGNETLRPRDTARHGDDTGEMEQLEPEEPLKELENAERLKELGAPKKLKELIAPKEPAKLTNGETRWQPTVEDCPDD